jgi:hypothetical protein
LGATQYRDVLEIDRLPDLIPTAQENVNPNNVVVVPNNENSNSWSHTHVLNLANSASKTLDLQVGTRLVNLLPYYTPQAYILGTYIDFNILIITPLKDFGLPFLVVQW